MRKPNLAPIVADVVKFTKENMLSNYKLRNREAILREYHDFRTFTRFLCIRGNYGSRDLRMYLNKQMQSFMLMLLESGADWRN